MHPKVYIFIMMKQKMTLSLLLSISYKTEMRLILALNKKKLSDKIIITLYSWIL